MILIMQCLISALTWYFVVWSKQLWIFLGSFWQYLEIFRKFSVMFVWPSNNFWRIFGVCLPNKQNNTCYTNLQGRNGVNVYFSVQLYISLICWAHLWDSILNESMLSIHCFAHLAVLSFVFVSDWKFSDHWNYRG